jgi:hypothetical protein
VQNFALGGFSAPHEGHSESIRVPHSAQNFAFAAFSVWHFGQRIVAPLDPARLIYHAEKKRNRLYMPGVVRR